MGTVQYMEYLHIWSPAEPCCWHFLRTHRSGRYQNILELQAEKRKCEFLKVSQTSIFSIKISCLNKAINLWRSPPKNVHHLVGAEIKLKWNAVYKTQFTIYLGSFHTMFWPISDSKMHITYKPQARCTNVQMIASTDISNIITKHNFAHWKYIKKRAQYLIKRRKCVGKVMYKTTVRSLI